MSEEAHGNHREVWKVNQKNIERWHRESLAPKQESPPGYWKGVVFVLTDHLLCDRKRNAKKR